ncbi:MAG: hypothetical protein A2622_08080 [Bdellovibrionales bacterium RIFCSPHIGHO2_01_FULL_40_29]|nr:MAG: hypothetical protein A2622_08080 [Bdellovibrionales bacterium RIFCSPHIGHO2_01_FULL_40_29]OFZ35454.1 MAG: hypothetical protein A3D17_07315 [Bdellovibrionales bacterium RIFCSPHIGHO2_02_FULL_40_15]
MLTWQQFQSSMQKLIGHYTSEAFIDELTQAKKEFFGNTGSLDENKPHYNLRMHQFYEWYFLTRPLKSYMKTPLEVCTLHRELRLSPEDEQVIEILRDHRHSIFEFLKVKKDEVFLKDLFKNEKITVHHTDLIFGFDTKEFFEARLVKIDKNFYFLKSFCFHPESAQKFISAEVKVHQKNRDLNLETFLLRLNKMRYKFEQYKHVKPELIYTNDNRLGL